MLLLLVHVMVLIIISQCREQSALGRENMTSTTPKMDILNVQDAETLCTLLKPNSIVDVAGESFTLTCCLACILPYVPSGSYHFICSFKFCFSTMAISGVPVFLSIIDVQCVMMLMCMLSVNVNATDYFSGLPLTSAMRAEL